MAQTMIIDNGTACLKVGAAIDESPYQIPTVVGRLKKQHLRHESETDILVGSELKASFKQSRSSSLCYPIQEGIVTDWDMLEQLWRDPFDQSKAVVEDVYMTLHPKQKDLDRALSQIFESLEAQRSYIGDSAAASLYASGRTTGLVIDIGEGCASCVPIFEGHVIQHAVSDKIASGKTISDLIRNVLKDQDPHLSLHITIDVLRDMKEKLCKVGTALPRQDKYQLPDGQWVSQASIQVINDLANDIWFKPTNRETQIKPLHENTSIALMKTDLDLRPSMLNNVILAGGCTLFDGFIDAY